MVDDSQKQKTTEGRTMIHEAGGLFINAMTFSRGERIAKHCHDYDHFSILATGRVVVEMVHPDGRTERIRMEGPAVIHVRAGIRHKIIAASAFVAWYCIHNSDRAEASIADRAIIAEAAGRG